MSLSKKEAIILDFLGRYVTTHKKQEIERVLAERTRYITIVLEDIYQSQNASAALRTCECMGIQDVHIIEDRNPYKVNKGVLRGANKWLTIHRYQKEDEDNTSLCFHALRSMGYRILSTDPETDGNLVGVVDITRGPVALVFGNELEGLSDRALNGCDEKVRFPMTGFTESMNISATVSAMLAILTMQLRSRAINYKLSEAEKEELRLEWYRKVVRRSAELEKVLLGSVLKP